jgi:DNA repair protein SbcD/Mre11
MRILHTGDWHIGQTLKSFGREHEHRAALDQIVSLVADREVDAMIVAGDVFDSPNPSGASQLLFYETLARLNRARPGMTIVITAGNHDSAGRLEAPRPLMNALNVHVVGSVRRPEGTLDASRHVIALRDAKGRIGAEVLAVSHPTAACLPILAREDGEAQPISRAVHAMYHDLYAAARSSLSGAPLIVTGHLHVAGAVESEGAERRILVGGQHAVPTTVFPEAAAYVALGHLHKAQWVGGETVRYCGSILPLSATEQSYDHGVSLLTVADARISVEHVSIKRSVPFLRIPAHGDLRLDELAGHLAGLKLDATLSPDQQPFAQVRLARVGLGAGFRADAERIAAAFPLRIVDLGVTPAEADPVAAAPDPFVRLAERLPEDLFRKAFERVHKTQPSAAHLDVFHRIAADA